MPSNSISINGSDTLKWEVSDSKMPLLIAALAALGEPAYNDAVVMQDQMLADPYDSSDDSEPPHSDISMSVFDAEKQVMVVRIQKGPIAEVGVNGVQIDTVVEACRDLISGFNDRFPCAENTITIGGLDIALTGMALRTRDREKRNVEGHDKL